MILDSTTKKIQIVLAKATTTNNLPVTVDYVDMTSTTTTVGLQLSNTNGTSDVDICDAPGSNTKRKVNFISVCNKDTEWARVTIKLNNNSTIYNYINKLSLAPNMTLQYTDVRGWVTIDSGGNMVVASGLVDIQSFTANGTWTKPTAATYCQVDVCGGGGAGGGGSSAASGTVSGGGGGGGGRRIKMVFLASDLQKNVSVTVGSATSTTNAETDGSSGNDSKFQDYLIGYAGGGGAWNADISASGGGGGGGGTTAGTSATTTGAIGGSAFAASVAGTSYSDDRGGGGTSTAAGGNSYYGGGGGGGSNVTTYTGSDGGGSFISAGGGAAGGSSNGSTNYAGGAGGNSGGSVTTSGGGGTAGTAAGGNGGNGNDGDSTKSGQGGGGGGSNFAGTAGNGGNGGALGGGGGGGGGGTTGGTGGAGGRGGVTVISW